MRPAHVGTRVDTQGLRPRSNVSGKVSVGPAFTDETGRSVRTVSVKGKDVARTMIKAGLAKKVDPEKPASWCS